MEIILVMEGNSLNDKVKYGIIGGTGVYDMEGSAEESIIETKYGSVSVTIRKINNIDVAFLPRHGKGHSVPPHLINYRANMMALKTLGVEYVYATAAVGSCNRKYKVGDVVVITDFMDFTKVRPVTFYEGEEGVKHVEMTDPYCKELRRHFTKNAPENDIEIKGEAVYVCTEGPRFETAAEIKMYSMVGGDVVGMTNVPEVVLAKELGLCYSCVGIITNMCTGMGDGEIELHEIAESIGANKERITNTFVNIFMNELDNDYTKECNCENSIISL